MNVSDAIRYKRAIREFQPRPLPEEAVRAILNAGKRSQSSKNTQPWQFIAIQDRDVLTSLSKLGDYAGHIAGAGLCVAILTADPAKRPSLLFDSGQAAAYMQLAAWELGIGSCLASIYQPDEARKLLGFPDDYELRFAISFGYPRDPERLDQPPRKGGRRSLEELVHWDGW
jgi:nitroreductase